MAQVNSGLIENLKHDIIIVPSDTNI
jgi:hypothetical protein